MVNMSIHPWFYHLLTLALVGLRVANVIQCPWIIPLVPEIIYCGILALLLIASVLGKTTVKKN